MKRCHRCGDDLAIHESIAGVMACPPCADVIREEHRRAASVIPAEMCPKCWSSFGKALWAGSCICTGHVNPIFTMPGTLHEHTAPAPRAVSSVRDRKSTASKSTKKAPSTENTLL